MLDNELGPAGTGEETAYDGFMSYSHAADGLLAPRLQSALQRFAKPWWKRRAVRIFRDESSLSANPHLWSSISDALDTSGWFILLLSPDAAQSQWVNQEIDYWVQNRDPNKILPVVTDGTFGWAHGDVDGDAVPPALEGVFAEEPRWVDVRWARDEDQLDLKDPRFADAVADIASAVRGVPKDDLASEEVRQHRRTTRTAWGAGALVLLLGVIAALAAVQATRSADEAQGNALLASARNVSRTDMDLALLLTLEAAESLGRGDGSVEGELHNIFMVGTEVRSLATSGEVHAKSFAVAKRPHASQIAVTAAGNSIRLLETDTMEPVATFGEPVAAFSSSIPSIAFDQSGGRLAAIDTSGTIRIWDVETQSVLKEIETGEGATGRVMFGPDGDTLITSIHSRTVWDIDSERVVWRNDDRAFSIGGADISFDRNGRWLAWAARELSEVAIVDLETGERIWTIPLPGAVAVDFHPQHDLLAAKSQNSGTEFYDLASGAPVLVGAIPGGAPTAIQFDDRGALLAVGGDLGVEIHRPADTDRPGADWERVAFLPTGASFGFSYAFLSDGTDLAIGHKQGAGVFSLQTTGETGRVQLDSPAWTIEAVPGTSKAYTAHPPLMGRNAVSIYDVADSVGRLLSNGDLTAPGWAVARASSPTAAVAYLPEQDVVAVLDPSTGEVLTELEHPGDSAPRVLDVSADGSTIAAGLVSSKEIVVWDGASGAITHRFPVDGIGDIRAIRLRPMDSEIAVGGDTGLVVVDPESPSEARLLSAQGSFLNVDFSPDGMLLAAADDTFGFLHVFDLVDDSRTVRISAPGALDPAFNADGSQLILGAAQSGVIAFDTQTWERRWTIPVDNLPGVVLTLDVAGDDVLFSPMPGHLFGVTLDFDELLDIAQARLNRGFTAAECTQYRIDPCPTLDEIRSR